MAWNFIPLQCVAWVNSIVEASTFIQSSRTLESGNHNFAVFSVKNTFLFFFLCQKKKSNTFDYLFTYLLFFVTYNSLFSPIWSMYKNTYLTSNS